MGKKRLQKLIDHAKEQAQTVEDEKERAVWIRLHNKYVRKMNRMK